jgi:glycosyltransferase involved in cell wall biosynthesis
MTIIHVLQWFELGGGESLALRLAAWQRERGYDVVALGFAAGPLVSEFAKHGVQVEVCRKRAGFDPTLFGRLTRAFLRRRAAVVHLHDQQSLVYAAAPARITGARVVCTKHGATVERARRLFLRRLGARFVHDFVAVSESTADTARAHHEVDPRKLQVVLNGVDLNQFRPDSRARAAVRRELGIAANAWVIGTVGRQEREKDPELLVRAVGPLLDAQTQAVLVGSGQLSGQLAQLVGASALPGSIHLLGSRRDVPQLLAAFDLFVLSSRTEGLPLVLLEAMATGLPVVSTAVGGIPAVVQQDRTGLLVSPSDEGALRAAIAALKQDPDRAKRMGEQGRLLAGQSYSFDAMARRYMQLYAVTAKSPLSGDSSGP